MTTYVWLTFGTTIGIVSPLLYWHYLRNPGRTAPTEDQEESRNQYEAVEIRPCLMACDAVSKLAGRRFLRGEAPKLPVPGCNQTDCACTIRVHQDRRGEDDRRDPLGRYAGFVARPEDEDRRTSQNRRKDDRKAPPRSYYNEY